ncbi:MAG: DMT family transporter [Bryobacteraceae bacterium]
MSRSQAADAALVWNTLVWGSTFVLVKNALAGISPLLFLALRFSLATAILLVLFGGLGKGPYTPKALAAGTVTGTFLFAGYLFQTWGLRLTSPPKSAFLTGLNTVMVPLLAALVYKIKPQRSELLGVLAATAGLALMTLQASAGSGFGLINRGDLLTIVCALAFAAHIVTLGHFSEQVGFELLSLMQVGVAALWSLALFGWVEPPYWQWRPSVVYAILITGILATAAAFTIQAWAQQYTTATRTALIYMLEPVFAVITSYLVAGEGLSARAAVGAGLILGGVLLVELKPLNPRPHPFG